MNPNLLLVDNNNTPLRSPAPRPPPSPSPQLTPHQMEELKKVTTPPSQSSLLASVPSQFFDTPLERFEPFRVVCEDLVLESVKGNEERGKSNRNHRVEKSFSDEEEEEEEDGEEFRRHLVSQAIQTQLIERMETLDLMKDAVQNVLSREVRKSSTFLVDSVQRIQDLDMEVTRATILASAARRRLREAKASLLDNHVKICRLSKEKKDLLELVERVRVLREAKALRDAAFEAERNESLAAAVERTRAAMEWLASIFALGDGGRGGEYRNLKALKSLEERLVNSLPTLRLRWEQEAREWFLSPPPVDTKTDDEDVKARIGSLLQSFGMLSNELGAVTATTSTTVTEPDLNFIAFLIEVTQTSIEYAFCVDARGANHVMRNYVRASRLIESSWATKDDEAKQKAFAEALAEGRTRIWGTLEATLVYLIKTPETRELSVEDFATLVRSCEETISVNRYFVGEQLSLSVSGAIRHRARAFAQQTQAEGFEAVRGFLSRERFIPITDDVSREAVISKLEFLDSTATMVSDKKRRTVMVPTTISGIPKTLTKTIELMRSLPQMSGEAFRGFIRIVEYYLYHILTKFIRDVVVPPSTASSAATTTTTATTLAAMQRKTPLVRFYDSLCLSLKDWIVSSSSSSFVPSSSSETTTTSSEVPQAGTINSPTHASTWYTVLVAAESLDFLMELIKLSRPASEPLLPAVERAALVNRLYVEIPEATMTLVKPALKSSTMRRLLHYYPLREGILTVNWGDERADIPMRANAHIFALLERMRGDSREEIKRHVVKEDLDSRVSLAAIWDEACAFLLDTMLDELAANVKSCAPQNRALMSLDLATLFSGLNDIALAHKRADEWIKSYYLGTEEEITNWVRDKREVYALNHLASAWERGMFGRANPKRVKEIKVQDLLAARVSGSSSVVPSSSSMTGAAERGISESGNGGKKEPLATTNGVPTTPRENGEVEVAAQETETVGKPENGEQTSRVPSSPERRMPPDDKLEAKQAKAGKGEEEEEEETTPSSSSITDAVDDANEVEAKEDSSSSS